MSKFNIGDKVRKTEIFTIENIINLSWCSDAADWRYDAADSKGRLITLRENEIELVTSIQTANKMFTELGYTNTINNLHDTLFNNKDDDCIYFWKTSKKFGKVDVIGDR